MKLSPHDEAFYWDEFEALWLPTEFSEPGTDTSLLYDETNHLTHYIFSSREIER